ncbi:uncharacterized protein LOC142349707 [Convolutriloba macropyga]|uniref:uncharacterized protein LOC142349707 n=1 Tax=Convolutriloba macropyga TaxID=536237 RepID=UPI003F525380
MGNYVGIDTSRAPDTELLEDRMFRKFATDSFMVPLCLTTILLNAYFIATVLFNDKLRSLDYFLISTQCLIDLTFTGILGLSHYLLDFWATMAVFCSMNNFLDPETPNALRFPEWSDICTLQIITRSSQFCPQSY